MRDWLVSAKGVACDFVETVFPVRSIMHRTFARIAAGLVLAVMAGTAAAAPRPICLPNQFTPPAGKGVVAGFAKQLGAKARSVS